MACAAGLLAEDCAADHWSPVLGGRREGAQWRAPCPVCLRARRLEYDAPKSSVRWNIFCHCDRAAVRKVLADRLPECMPTRRGKAAIDHQALIALMLADMPAKSRQLAGLELAGISTTDALNMLGISQGNHSRTIAGRNSAASKLKQKPRKGTHQF
jgi:hypothetical protein